MDSDGLVIISSVLLPELEGYQEFRRIVIAGRSVVVERVGEFDVRPANGGELQIRSKRPGLLGGTGEIVVSAGDINDFARVGRVVRYGELVYVEHLVLCLVDEQIACALDFGLLVGVVDASFAAAATAAGCVAFLPVDYVVLAIDDAFAAVGVAAEHAHVKHDLVPVVAYELGMRAVDGVAGTVDTIVVVLGCASVGYTAGAHAWLAVPRDHELDVGFGLGSVFPADGICVERSLAGSELPFVSHFCIVGYVTVAIQYRAEGAVAVGFRAGAAELHGGILHER